MFSVNRKYKYFFKKIIYFSKLNGKKLLGLPYWTRCVVKIMTQTSNGQLIALLRSSKTAWVISYGWCQIRSEWHISDASICHSDRSHRIIGISKIYSHIFWIMNNLFLLDKKQRIYYFFPSEEINYLHYYI